MSLTSSECQVSELVNSDACPRPTTRLVRRQPPLLRGDPIPQPVVGRGHVSLLTNLDAWHSESFTDIYIPDRRLRGRAGLRPRRSEQGLAPRVISD